MKTSTALIIQSFRRTLLLKQKDLDYFSSLYCLPYSFFFSLTFTCLAIKAFSFINLKQINCSFSLLSTYIQLTEININTSKNARIFPMPSICSSPKAAIFFSCKWILYTTVPVMKYNCNDVNWYTSCKWLKIFPKNFSLLRCLLDMCASSGKNKSDIL